MSACRTFANAYPSVPDLINHLLYTTSTKPHQTNRLGRTTTADGSSLLGILLLRPLCLCLLNELLLSAVFGVFGVCPVCATDGRLMVEAVDDAEAESGPSEDLGKAVSTAAHIENRLTGFERRSLRLE